MPSKLTKRFVDALRATEKPYEARDTEVTGFLCRVQPTGTKTFWFAYPFPGKRAPRFRLGQYPNVSVEGARALAKAAAGDVSKGIDPQARKETERLQLGRDRLAALGVFLNEKYEPWAIAHLKSATAQLQRIRSDFADRLDKPMVSLHPLAVEGIRQGWRKNGKKPRTIERDIQRIQGVLSHAVECGVLQRHPFKGALKKMQYDKTGRVRFLSAEEEASLRAALVAREDRLRAERMRFNTWRIERHREPLPERSGEHIDHLRPMVLLALNTGMRRGELFSLIWSAVDLEAGIVTVRAESAKSGQTRRIPLNTEAVTVLTTWRKRQADAADGFVFPGDDGKRLTNVTKSWGGVVKAAKLVNFNFHDLRHTFASRLVQAGTDLNTVRELLGHSEIKTTLIYAHLAEGNLRAAVQRVVAA
jgi:integrase